jgi:uncharacterized phage protein (TIGR01671 family)
MSRELKFRVWNKATRSWLNEEPGTHLWSEYSINIFSGEVVEFVTGDNKFFSRADEPSFYFDKTVVVKESPYVIQQYTGLKNKNGKEIYEGDILERIGSSGSFVKIVVMWNTSECCFVYNNVCNLHGNSNPLTNNFVNLSDWTYWVVCGNIHENPELLK